MKQFYTVNEVADIYDVSPTTVKKWIHGCEIKAVKQLIGYGGIKRWVIPVKYVTPKSVFEHRNFDPRTIRTMNRDYLNRLDEIEEALYDSIECINEIRHRIEKGEL